MRSHVERNCPMSRSGLGMAGTVNVAAAFSGPKNDHIKM